jgi:hypothetical protein
VDNVGEALIPGLPVGCGPLSAVSLVAPPFKPPFPDWHNASTPGSLPADESAIPLRAKTNQTNAGGTLERIREATKLGSSEPKTADPYARLPLLAQNML